MAFASVASLEAFSVVYLPLIPQSLPGCLLLDLSGIWTILVLYSSSFKFTEGSEQKNN